MLASVMVDGKIVDSMLGHVNCSDHGLLYGDGVFEGIRFFNRECYELDAHLNRLRASAEKLRIKFPDRSKIICDLHESISSSSLNSGYIRVLLTRGQGDLGITPSKCSEPSLIIIVKELKIYSGDKYKFGVNLTVSSVRKPFKNQIDCTIKSCNYLNNIMASWEAIDKKFDDALMMLPGGIISEATVANIFFMKGERLFTPDIDKSNCLPGITRAVVIRIAKRAGFSVQEREIHISELKNFDAAFLTGTGIGLLPIKCIDNHELSFPEPLRKILKLHSEIAPN